MIQQLNQFSVNDTYNPVAYVVDNFYENPHEVRDFALNLNYFEDVNYFKGNRSEDRYIIPGTLEKFQDILGAKIYGWEDQGMCGRFQYCTAEEQKVYHCDEQNWAGVVYLTPNAPYESGTSFWAGKHEVRSGRDDRINDGVFDGGFYDKTKFKLVDTIGNVFNRLVIWDGRLIHSATEYFGTDITNSRLFHLFFFDCHK